MSELGDLFSPPFIEDVDGFVTASTITDLVNDLDSVFDSVESAIGNLYGISNGANVEPERFAQSVAASIGTQSEEYVVPSNIEFINYEQSFVLNDNKTFELDLIPSGPVLIDDSVHPTSFWTLQLSLKDLSTETDYCIIGTLITFYAPAANFIITYNGIYPSFGKDNYLPNVIPNRKLRVASAITTPVVSNVSGIRYNIVVPTATSNGYKEFTTTLEYGFAPHIEAYVDPLGATECPPQYVSVWHKVGDKFNKVKTNAIFIKSNTEYEFTTNEVITLVDEYAIVLANRGIAEELAATIDLLLNHSHNSSDGTSTIAHASLNDLIPVSDNADIKYAGSVLKQNHHPQYVHREGYQNDPGTYNNAMLGDFLLASINPDSLFNNILSNSNKIFFSSTSAGHSLHRRVNEADLHVASSANGLSISYDDTDITNYGLNIAGHKISNVDSDLMINAISGLTIFQNELEELQNISVGEVLADTVNATTAVNISNNGVLALGNISITHGGQNVTISGVHPLTDKLIIDTICDIGIANIDNLDVGVINLEGTDKIKFLPAIGLIDTFLAPLTSGGARFSSKKPLAFTGIGKNTGLSLNNADATEVYANIYTSSENGLIPTNSDHNTYFETGTQDVYFLQDTTSDKTVDGTLYAWDDAGTAGTNVTNLKNWPKSNVYANTLNGTIFKIDQYSSISSTGSAQGLNSNKTIIHADNGVLLSRSQSSDYAVASGNKASLELDEVNANNITTLAITAGSLNSDALIIANGGSFTNGGLSTFNGDVIFNNTLTLNDDVTINANLKVLNSITGGDNAGNLTIAAGGTLAIAKNMQCSGTALFAGATTFNDDVVMNNTVSVNDDLIVNANLKVLTNITGADNDGNLTIASGGVFTVIKNTQIFGTTLFANAVTLNSPVVANSLITANAGIDVNNMEVSNTLDVTGTANIANLNIDLVTTDSIVCQSIDALSSSVPSSFKSITASANLSVAGDVAVNGNITLASGKHIDAAGASIINMTMPIISSPNDAATKQYVDDELANIGTANLLKIIYPINSIYMSSHMPNNPGDISGPFGALAFGTWEAYAEGRVLIGTGTASDANGESRSFTAPAEGGEYGHSLSVPELAAHTHDYTFSNDRNDDGDNGSRNCIGSGILVNGFTTTSTGNGDRHNNVQPYIAAYIWRRTA